MRKFELLTKAGARYYVHDNGDIERTDMQFSVSGQWKLSAIVNSHGAIVTRFDDLSDWLNKKPDFLFKNRNPRFTVMDLDHGTNRVWGNTKYHGIQAIYPVNA